MSKPSDREIDESFDHAGYDYDPDGEALLRHVLLDDELPQGLHRGGLKFHEDPTGWEGDE